MKTSITAVILTRNSAATIRECLQAVIQVCDEVIVLDTHSEDGTVEICRDLGIRLIEQDWLGYSKTKNLGNDLAQNDWILSIDSDEILSPELIDSLSNLVPQEKTVYSLDRITRYGDKWIRHSGWYPDWKTRLFHRKYCYWVGDYVHETLFVPPGCREIRLPGKLFHYSYQSSDDHMERIRKYARLAAEELHKAGKTATFSRKWFSPVARFCRTYIIKKGFLDGKEGWMISKRNAYMVHLRYVILEELRKAEKEKLLV